MVRTSVLFCAILLFFAISTQECSGFKWLFIGNVSDEEYSRYNLCFTKTCLDDADILIKRATLNASVDPCVDFRNFSLGEFHEHRHLNDRYQFIGFQNDVVRNLYEKKRVALEQKQKENEPKVFRIMKNYFAKCRISDYIRATAGDELISILRRYASLSQASNGSWLGNDYTKVLFDSEPFLMFQIFLHHGLQLCDDPRDDSKKIICFQWGIPENYENELPSLLKRLNLKNKEKQEIVEIYASYHSKQQEIVKSYASYHSKQQDVDDENEIYKIKDLPSRFPSENINWLKIINDKLFQRSQVTEDEEILITNPVLMQALLSLLTESEPQLVANTFSAMFIFNHQKAFNIYKHSPLEAAKLGTIRSYQRMEVCIGFIESGLQSALLSLLATKYYNEDLQKAAAGFASEVVADYIFAISFHEGINDEVKQKILEKLSTIKLWVAFPPNVLNQTMIDEFYEEIELDGSESFVTTWMEIAKFKRKLSLERQSSPFGDFSDDDVSYDFEKNILNIPVIHTVYPMFHQNRSRFINMATLHMSIVLVIDKGVTEFVNKEMNTTIPWLFSSRNLAHSSYDKWLLDGGQELQLPGFKLTNRQMFWLAEANVYGVKIHKSSEEHVDPRAVLSNKYFHVHHKIDSNFRKDFNCGDMTEAEIELYLEYLGKLGFNKIVQQFKTSRANLQNDPKN